MIQKGSILRVVDNSGGKFVRCIRVISGLKKKYAGVGDLILVSVRQLRKKRRSISKVRKGFVVLALIIRLKWSRYNSFGSKVFFFENSVILLHKETKQLIGSKIFGFLPVVLRYSNFMRVLSIGAGFRL